MITKVWFDKNRIYIENQEGAVLNRPLEAFPILLEAPMSLREKYEISKLGDAIRWKELDEDIHESSFKDTTEPNTDNEIGRLFLQFPWLNVSEVARTIGINKSLLSKYIYGIKTPSQARAEEIKSALRQMGYQLIAV